MHDLWFFITRDNVLPNSPVFSHPLTTHHNFIEVLDCKIQSNGSECISYLPREREVSPISVGVMECCQGLKFLDGGRLSVLTSCSQAEPQPSL